MSLHLTAVQITPIWMRARAYDGWSHFRTSSDIECEFALNFEKEASHSVALERDTEYHWQKQSSPSPRRACFLPTGGSPQLEGLSMIKRKERAE
ncbi:hypothetical protein V1478_014546 [Vespula squamosa]|uniref:Uncharacterized protein n=1 Tax=Vespula squamosa TaxID=30214 RepID=A0ABD2AB02_VESSQ